MMQPAAGSSFVNPSEAFSSVVAMISSMIAEPNNMYCILVNPPLNTEVIILCRRVIYNADFGTGMHTGYKSLLKRHCTFQTVRLTILHGKRK